LSVDPLFRYPLPPGLSRVNWRLTGSVELNPVPSRRAGNGFLHDLCPPGLSRVNWRLTGSVELNPVPSRRAGNGFLHDLCPPLCITRSPPGSRRPLFDGGNEFFAGALNGFPQFVDHGLGPP
jgi:hypothetical protein